MKDNEDIDVYVVDVGKNYLHEIKELWAFVSVDEHGEGLVSELINGMWFPFVCADIKRLNDLRPRAEKIAKKAGRTIRLIKLSNREVITTIIGGN